MNDSIISEIRRVRVRLAQDAGNDFHRLCEVITAEANALRESGKWRMVSEIPAAADALNEESLDPTGEKRSEKRNENS